MQTRVDQTSFAKEFAEAYGSENDGLAEEIGKSFHVYLLAFDSVNLQATTISAPKIGICSTNMQISQSYLDSRGKGCPPGFGTGRGRFNQDCAGSGGAHGGFGGFGLKYEDSTPCNFSP